MNATSWSITDSLRKVRKCVSPSCLVYSMKRVPAIALGSLAWSITSTIAFAACPNVGRLPDINCDGEVKIVILGDSLVSGTGDTKNRGKGGYVLRAQESLPEAQFYNEGVPGLRTLTLASRVSKAFKSSSSRLRTELLSADVVILDLGRNDRWLFGLPKDTLRNLKRVRTLIESNVAALVETRPLVVTAVLMLPNRGSQGPWVKELNVLIRKSSSARAPADLRFDKVSKRLLSTDNIHPTSKGYAALSAVLVRYLLAKYPVYAARLTD